VTVVVSYVPDATGYLAVTEAAREALWRETDVVVVNVVDSAGYTRPTAADERDLDALAARLAAQGVPHRMRLLDVGAETAADAVLGVAREVGAEYSSWACTAAPPSARRCSAAMPSASS
jgi:nucleotide-binding universal stress UspA family protein